MQNSKIGNSIGNVEYKHWDVVKACENLFALVSCGESIEVVNQAFGQVSTQYQIFCEFAVNWLELNPPVDSSEQDLKGGRGLKSNSNQVEKTSMWDKFHESLRLRYRLEAEQLLVKSKYFFDKAQKAVERAESRILLSNSAQAGKPQSESLQMQKAATGLTVAVD